MAVYALVRGLHFASLMIVFGSEAFAAVSSGSPSPRLSKRILLIAAGTALATAALSLFFAAAQMSGAGLFSISAATLSVAVTQTLFGQVALVRLGLLILLIFSLLFLHRPAWNALLAGLALAALSLTSHAAAAGPQEYLVLRAANDAAHLLAAGFWVGGLVVLVFQAATRRNLESFLPLLRRFSTFGMVAVAVLAVAGVINGVLILGGEEAHWSFGYIMLLTVKLLLAALMIALALTNRFGFLPGIAKGDENAARNLFATTVAELVLGAAILLVVGFLGLSAPLKM